MARRRGKSLVAREQRRLERLRQSDVHRVVSGEIATQRPHPRQKEVLRIAPQWKVGEIDERRTTALGIELARSRIAPNDLCDLDVDQMRRVQRFPGIKQAPFDRFGGGCPQEHFDQRRSVDNDHERSRSARMARAGAIVGVIGGRSCNRARNSSMVGRSAMRRISLSK